MSDVSTFRLYLLRALYLLMVVGLAFDQWPAIINHPLGTPMRSGVARAMLGALSVMALIGLRYPLQMLPLLFYEATWKAIWLLLYALPVARAGVMDAGYRESVVNCSLGVIVLIVI